METSSKSEILAAIANRYDHDYGKIDVMVESVMFVDGKDNVNYHNILIEWSKGDSIDKFMEEIEHHTRRRMYIVDEYIVDEEESFGDYKVLADHGRQIEIKMKDIDDDNCKLVCFDDYGAEYVVPVINGEPVYDGISVYDEYTRLKMCFVMPGEAYEIVDSYSEWKDDSKEIRIYSQDYIFDKLKDIDDINNDISRILDLLEDQNK